MTVFVAFIFTDQDYSILTLLQVGKILILLTAESLSIINNKSIVSTNILSFLHLLQRFLEIECLSIFLS